jgi:hypothetical protein
MVALLESDASLPAPLDPTARLRAKLQGATPGDLAIYTVAVELGLVPLAALPILASVVLSLPPTDGLIGLMGAILNAGGLSWQDVLPHECPHGSDCPGPECLPPE